LISWPRQVFPKSLIPYGWGIADQGLSSLTNFLLAVLAGRIAGPGGLGQVSVGFFSYLAILGFQRALLTDPLIATSTALPEQSRNEAARAAARWVVLLGAAGSAILCVIGLTVRGEVGSGMLNVAPWILPTLMQDFWRVLLFREQKAASAAINDGLWLATMVLASPLTLFVGGAASVVAVWGLGATAGMVLGFLQVRIQPMRTGSPVAWFMRDAWPLGRWLFAESAAYSVGSYGAVMLIALVLGSEELGGIRAVQTLFSPISLIAPAMALPGLPALVRALEASRSVAVRKAWRLSAAMTALSLAYVGVVGALPGLLTLVFGREFLPYAGLVWIIGLGAALTGAATGVSFLLKAERRGARLLWSRVVASIATVALIPWMGLQFGTAGAAWALVLGSALGALVISSSVFRGDRRDRHEELGSRVAS
jgi:O-antigen/teichoic acid export membrane protein